MSTPHTELAPWPANPLAALVAPRTWLATLHLLVNLWLGIAAFTVVITGLTLSFGLLPLALLGVVVFGGTVALARGYATLERRRFALLLGVDIPAPPRLDPAAGVLGQARAVLGSGVTWRQIGYCLLGLPLGVTTFTLTVVAWSVPVALLILPFLPHADIPLAWFAPPVGLALLLVSPFLVRGLAAADAAVARAMLGPFTHAELAGRVHDLEDSRAKVVDAAEAERRRIERDLHDGAQQRLVSLAMTLGRAQARYDTELLANSATGVGYLLKDRVADVAEFVSSLRRVTAGGTALDPEVVSQLLVRARRSDPLGKLSQREREALTLMAEGRSNSAIAAALVVSDGAVEKHIRSIFTKLDLPLTDTDHRRVLAVLRYLKG